MTDHLEEAKTALSELEPDVFSNPPIGPEMAQAHALIAIAEELRRHNDNTEYVVDALRTSLTNIAIEISARPR